MSLSWRIICIACIYVLLFHEASTTFVNRCMNNNVQMPDEVQIQGCDRSPCTLYIGTPNTMMLRFRAPRYLEHVAPNAAIYMGTLLPYPMPQTDACEGIVNTPCPLAQGEMVVYEFPFFASYIFKEATYDFEFSLVDTERNFEPVECFKVTIQLKNQPGMPPPPPSPYDPAMPPPPPPNIFQSPFVIGIA